MAKDKVPSLERLKLFFEQCKLKFASKTDVEANDLDIETYVLGVDYDTDIKFDTDEIVI